MEPLQDSASSGGRPLVVDASKTPAALDTGLPPPLQDPTSSSGRPLVVDVSKTPAALDTGLPPPLQDSTSSGGRPLVNMIQNNPPRCGTSLYDSGGVSLSPYRTCTYVRVCIYSFTYMYVRRYVCIKFRVKLRKFERMGEWGMVVCVCFACRMLFWGLCLEIRLLQDLHVRTKVGCSM